jgi:ferritin-like metal-binding protein YciE
MPKVKTLEDLFQAGLKDIFFAEKKILTALPKMAKAAINQDLRAAFEKHVAETEEQVSRLEQVFEEIEAKPQSKTCDAIMGIIAEGQEIMKDTRALRRSMRGFWRLPKPSSITKSVNTAR